MTTNRQVELVGSGAGGRLRAHRAGAEGAAVPPAEQGAEGHREAFLAKLSGTEPGADHAADPALDADRRIERQAGAPRRVSRAATGRRYRSAGRGGRRA